MKVNPAVKAANKRQTRRNRYAAKQAKQEQLRKEHNADMLRLAIEDELDAVELYYNQRIVDKMVAMPSWKERNAYIQEMLKELEEDDDYEPEDPYYDNQAIGDYEMNGADVCYPEY